MREIENTTRSHLIQLLGDCTSRLTPEQQRWIATWAVLKSAIDEYDTVGKPTMHHMQRRRLRFSKLPPEAGCGVWIGRYERSKWEPCWLCTPMLIHPKGRASSPHGSPASYFNSYVSTQVVGSLFIHVLRTPMPLIIQKFRFPSPVAGKLRRIWPPSQYSIAWPPRVMDDHDADLAADAVISFMRGTVHPTGTSRTPPFYLLG
jgi:hypothetical protein